MMLNVKYHFLILLVAEILRSVKDYYNCRRYCCVSAFLRYSLYVSLFLFLSLRAYFSPITRKHYFQDCFLIIIVMQGGAIHQGLYEEQYKNICDLWWNSSDHSIWGIKSIARNELCCSISSWILFFYFVYCRTSRIYHNGKKF